jgi:hypothetical protein
LYNVYQPSRSSYLKGAGQLLVQMLEDKSSKINEFFKTSTPITSEISLNICKAVGIALRDGRKTLEEASDLILNSQA